MRFFTLLLILFASSVAVFAQKKVLVQSIWIDNNYAEVSANPFSKPEYEAAFLGILEQKLQERFGPVQVDYLIENKKIMFLDKAVAKKDPGGVMDDFKDLYNAKKRVDRQAYDMRLDIRMEIVDIFRGGARDNFQIFSKVVARDSKNKKLFRNKGKVNIDIPPVPFALAQLNATGTTVYEGFPMGEDMLVEALGKSLAHALEQKEEVESLAVERKPFDGYADFIDQAVSYKVVARNDYGDYLTKFRFFRILNFTKHRPLIVSRQSDQQGIMLGFREKRITDLGLQVSLAPVYEVGKLYKRFLLYSQFSPTHKEGYALNAVMTDKKALGAITWLEPIQFSLKADRGDQLGKFTFSVNSDSDLPKHETRSMSRVYHPWAAMEGVLQDKTFSMRTNPYLLNAVEIMWGGQMVGLVIHAAAPRRYLRKRKNPLPYYVYFHPECTESQQDMLLQTFQTFHIGNVLNHDQRAMSSMIQ